MSEIIILIVLLAAVGFIFANIVRNRGKQSATPEKTMSFNSEIDAVLPQSTPPTEFEYKQCALAVTLRIIGVINIFASLIIAMICGNEYGWIIAMVAIFSGCLGCIFCYALAKCVDAADRYLKNH